MNDKQNPALNNAAADADPACEGSVTRKQFITKVVTRGVAAGAFIAGAQITDKFLLPPAYAAASGGGGIGTNGGTDTDPFTDL